VNNQGVGKKVHKKHGKAKGPSEINESSTKIQKKMTNVIYEGNLDIFRRTTLNIKLGSKRKVSIMLIYVLIQT